MPKNKMTGQIQMSYIFQIDSDLTKCSRSAVKIKAIRNPICMLSWLSLGQDSKAENEIIQ